MPLLLNRKTSDGILLELRKDGTSVGSIGVIDADLTIYTSTSGHKGLRFGNGYIAPTDNTGTITDNTTDLGLSSQRFKDLHLSGTISSGDISIGTDSGDPFNANAKIKIQDSGTAYIQIKTGTANSGGLLIGDTADDFVGGFIYNNSNNHLSLYSNDNISLELDDNYDVNVYQGGLQIGGTEVISSSRNLTNIGTISSGAITSSGVIDVHTGDSGIILKSGNSSATGTPDQFQIEHSFGNVNISNARGVINLSNIGAITQSLSDKTHGGYVYGRNIGMSDQMDLFAISDFDDDTSLRRKFERADTHTSWTKGR